MNKAKLKLDNYAACSIVEGFADFEPSPEQELEAWAYLIKTGVCWNLQGWYGRSAQNLINNGYITKNGNITSLGRDSVTS
jgi:hypothetical protein